MSFWGIAGKLPCCADFVSHSVPNEPKWILDRICHSIAYNVASDNDWAEAYARMSKWAFNLSFSSGTYYCGCIMSSIDAVGRKYPFYIVREGVWHHRSEQIELNKISVLMDKLLFDELELDLFQYELELLCSQRTVDKCDIDSSWWQLDGDKQIDCLCPSEEQLRFMVGL